MVDDFVAFDDNKDDYFDNNCPKYLLKFVDSEFFDSTISGYIHVQPLLRYITPEDRMVLTAAQADDGELSINSSFKDTSHPNELLFVAPLSDPSKIHLVKPPIDPMTGHHMYNFTTNERYRFPIIQSDLEKTLIGSYYALESSDVIIQDGSIALTHECRANLLKSKLNVTANGHARSYVIYNYRLFFEAIYNNIIEYLDLVSSHGFRFSLGMVSYYDNFDKDSVLTYLNKIDSLSQSNDYDKRLQAMMYLIHNKQKKYEDQKEFRLSIANFNSNSESTIKIINSFFNSINVKNDVKRSIIYKSISL